MSEQRVLLAANDGGHLQELYAMAISAFGAEARCWYVPDTAQSRSLLAGEDVIWAERAPSRDFRAMYRNLIRARRFMKRGAFRGVVSTGSSIALSVIPLALLSRCPMIYVESAARTRMPSVTGWLAWATPSVRTLSQHSTLNFSGWTFAGSVFDEFHADANAVEPVAIERAFVTLGTTKYEFSRLVNRLTQEFGRDIEFTWQIGATNMPNAPKGAVAYMPSEDVVRAMLRSDVIISHAGVGSALAALQLGRVPVLIPRRRRFGEHVDDHQELIARFLAAAGLAVYAEASEVTTAELAAATHSRVSRSSHRGPLSVVLSRAFESR